MAVIELDFYAEDAPHGASLGTLTDEDLEAIALRLAYRGAGAARFTGDRNAIDPALVVPGNLVRARVPIIQADPIFAFQLGPSSTKLLDEGGDTSVEYGGPGALSLLRHARLPIFPTNGNPKRGSATVEDKWWWRGQPYGAIAVRMLEEGKNNPTAANAALQHVTWSFTRDIDSDAAPWDAIAGEFEAELGDSIEQALLAFQDAGDFTLVMHPELLSIQAHQVYGVDRTAAAFAAGKIRVTEANALTSLERTRHEPPWTHIIVRGKGGVWLSRVSPDYVAGTPSRWGKVTADETDDPDLMAKIGDYTLLHQRTGIDAMEVELAPGDDELSGYYLPIKHYNPGDRITVHAPADGHGYTNKATRLTGVRIEIADAADDQNADETRRSLRTILEINGGSESGSHDPGGSRSSSGGAGGGSGHRHGRVWSLAIPDEQTGEDAAFGDAALDGNDVAVLVPITVEAADEAALAIFVELPNGGSVTSVHWRPTAGSATGQLAATARSLAASGGAGNVAAYTLDEPTPGTGTGGAGQIRVVHSGPDATVGVIRIDHTLGFLDAASATSSGAGPTTVTPDSEPGGYIATGISSADPGDTTLTTGTDRGQLTEGVTDPQGLEIGSQPANGG
jgi:hypothetical protein